MQDKTLIIIDDNPAIRFGLEEIFTRRGGFRVLPGAESLAEAATAFGKEIPDVAIVNMMMPECDGAELIMRLRREKAAKGTVFIGISPAYTEFLAGMCQRAGVSYVVTLPVDSDIIYERVRAAASGWKRNPAEARERLLTRRTDDVEEIATRYLLATGFSARHSGFPYIKMAIVIAVNDDSNNLKLTTVIYPEVAKYYNVSVRTVERTIRYAIDAAWLRGDLDAQHRLFGYTVAEDKGKPRTRNLSR